MENGRVIKIAIVGAESTGKTLLCEQLAKQYSTVWVPEYARDYFNHSDIYNYTLSDLETIATRQIEQEEQQREKANRFLFCDTAMITLKIWAELEFGTCPDSILVKFKTNSYDHYLITNNEVNWEKDAQRLNKFSRDKILNLNIRGLQSEQAGYTLVKGLEEQRFLNAKKAIDNLYGK
jgi:NadR type nicotinamide-nucleotide adenylyltransferase